MFISKSNNLFHTSIKICIKITTVIKKKHEPLFLKPYSKLSATYQQALDESSDVVCHAGRPRITGRQLNQSHQEVLALLDTFQGLL